MISSDLSHCILPLPELSIRQCARINEAPQRGANGLEARNRKALARIRHSGTWHALEVGVVSIRSRTEPPNNLNPLQPCSTIRSPSLLSPSSPPSLVLAGSLAPPPVWPRSASWSSWCCSWYRSSRAGARFSGLRASCGELRILRSPESGSRLARTPLINAFGVHRTRHQRVRFFLCWEWNDDTTNCFRAPGMRCWKPWLRPMFRLCASGPSSQPRESLASSFIPGLSSRGPSGLDAARPRSFKTCRSHNVHHQQAAGRHSRSDK